MLSSQHLPIRKEFMDSLVFDYLSKKKELKEFYDHFPDKEGYKNALTAIKKIKYNRSLLVEVLKEQSVRVKNSNAASLKNIDLISSENTFTITTGHQLCLFTGPLYFIYKIISVINLCEKLKTEFPENNFVPVYWMAGEDHDFEEVNHFVSYGKKIVWSSSQKGSVGSFTTDGLAEIIDKLKEILGNGNNADHLVKLFEEAYLKHSDMARATHYLVNELFGEYGLVVVDGNSKQLKGSFSPFFRKDIFENTLSTSVSNSIEKLKSLKYEIQVNPREVNCFYMEKGMRARIDKANGSFSVNGTDKIITKEQMESLIANETEKLSPNVVLRPCYQQYILPNLAYVGGPGELAYWLEYKTMFDELKIFYPVLAPRRSVLIIENNTLNKIKKLGFEMENVFNNEQELVKLYIEKNDNGFNLDDYKKSMEGLFKQISDEMGKVDKTLTATADAEKQKNLNSLAVLEQKAMKAIKSKLETEVNQIKSVKSKLFPDGVPQERIENFSTYYNKWGGEFLKTLKDNIKYDLENNDMIVIQEN